MALSKTTQDHDEIREWAEKRGGVPAEVASTAGKKGTGIVRIMFPKAPHANDGALEEISWDEFFAKFDANDLALVYQEQTAEGAESNFNKLIHPEEDEHPRKTGTKKTAEKSSAKKSAKKASGATKSSRTKSPGTKAAAKKAPAKKTAKKK